MSSCFSNSSVSVADTSCSNYPTNSCISSSSNMSQSIHNTVTYVYKIILTTAKELQVEVSWNKCQMNQGLNITFNNSSTPAFKLNTNSRIFGRLKGWRIVESNSNFKIEVFWDLSISKYQSSPEPVEGYYVIIMVDSEIGLVLGDLANEATKRKLEKGTKKAKFSLMVRRDYCSGNTLYTTRTNFSKNGAQHEITIRCCGGAAEEWLENPYFTICIDKKEVIKVERLKWNFRGNDGICVEGVVIDVLWDVNEWLMNPYSGCAIFMFRRRNGMELDGIIRVESDEEDMVLFKEQIHDMEGEFFSLLIYACKSL